MNALHSYFLNNIRQFIDEERIYTDELRRFAWGTDAGFYRLTPQIVVRAKNEAEVSKLLKEASKSGVAVTFRAAGTSLSGQAISDSVLVVAGKHWERYSVGEGGETITLQPGIVGAEVNRILKPYGRKFGPDPASIKSAMVGGIVMNNASGMSCGVWANSDRVLLSGRLVFVDGTVLDTADKASREAFAESHKTLIDEICAIRDEIRSDEVLAAYPELKCTHNPDNQGELCIGKEATFEMMQAILDEVIEIFPSEYIHIGGDEAGKGDWKLCEDCQRRMREEGLESVDELQSYMIHRIEEYLNARGRQIIGWDEILEGGLAPNATVMSWRGEEGGLMAAEAGHKVVMSPHGYCYIDAPQDAPYSQPESIGGYLPLEKVYSYDPAPATMSKDVSKYILGVQANLWAEFIVEDWHYEHMLWPRAIAIAEIGWSWPFNKDFADFRRRAVDIVDRMIEEGYTPFDLKNEIGNRPESKEDVKHLALGKSVTYLEPSRYYAPKYAAAWDATLTDGKRGTWTYADERWQGFLGRGGVDVIIDLEKVRKIHSISADFMQICGPGVFMPCLVEIAISEDGENYTKIAEIEHEVVVDELPSFKAFGWEGSAKARYIRYKAHRSKFSGFLFVDEIVVR